MSDRLTNSENIYILNNHAQFQSWPHSFPDRSRSFTQKIVEINCHKCWRSRTRSCVLAALQFQSLLCRQPLCRRLCDRETVCMIIICIKKRIDWHAYSLACRRSVGTLASVSKGKASHLKGVRMFIIWCGRCKLQILVSFRVLKTEFYVFIHHGIF